MADVKNQLSIYLALKRTQKEVKKSGPVINVFSQEGSKEGGGVGSHSELG